ncbi:hypothetical protein LBMAG56_15160 [Verrucomicrobiota bacterium]|nr:hypothetical protein LBMAG56_15160 [Verrucomicrobiota bacterium]
MNPDSHSLSTRRHFLASSSMGLGSVALAWLLNEQGLLAKPVKPDATRRAFDLAPKQPHATPRARAMISLFMQGGPSHMDLLDPKPELAKWDGQKFPGEIKYDNAAQASSKVLASPWKFQKHGQCGADVSELLPHLAGIVDDITIIRSMHTGVNNHGQSINALNTGRVLAGRPTLGSWLAYGLGAENRNLPAYIALTDPRGLPVLGVGNWSNGWLPSLFQGTVIRPREPRILNLDPPEQLRGAAQENYLSFLEQLNREHLAQRAGELDLEARIASFELAARMQTAAREALELTGESEATRKLYGLDDPATAEFGTRCLIARRLIERGVRFVSVYTRNQFWDHHGSILTALPASCKYVDQPAAALVTDLKARGLLDSTIVHWGGEMGRLPVVQNDAGRAKVGRDHNTYGFTMWVAGGGFKGGHIHGATDEWGHRAVKDVVNHYDYHATLLHLFGLDAKGLAYKRNGADQTLVEDARARVVTEILRG